MKITIGALVLCKVLISDPPSSNLPATNPEINSQSKIEQELPKSAPVRQSDTAINNISKQPVIKEGNVVYTMLEGEVVNIYKRNYYAPVGKTGKFEKREEEDLVIKSKEIDHLVISSRACGILSDYIYDEKTYKEELKKKQQAIKKASSKPAKEEIIVIRSDVVPEGFEKVELDPKIQEALEKEYDADVKKQELEANQKFLNNLENDQARFVKEQKEKEGFSITEKMPAAPTTVEETVVKEEVKEDVKETPIKEEKSSKELFATWEEERREKLEEERKRELAKKEAENKVKVQNKVKPVVSKSEKVEPAPIRETTPSSSKSILKDALKIITTE